MYQRISNIINNPKIKVVCVSKKQSLSSIKAVYSQGARDFGENYLQEAQEKISLCNYSDINWHFIGAIQSNKTSIIANMFQWVQSVDRIKVAEKLNTYRDTSSTPLNICIQVNIDREPQKSGCYPESLLDLAYEVNKMPNLKLRGLMIIPKNHHEKSELTKSFNHAKKLYYSLNESGMELDTLSMGMSQDYELAVECGSNMVRIGSAIFGPRST